MIWPDMNSLLEEGEIGDFSIKKYDITMNNLRAVLIEGLLPGSYVNLMQKSECIMRNSFESRKASEWFVEHAFGDVLIGGLGIGMVIMAIQDMEEVTSITVVEKYQEVIDLVGNQLPFLDKVQIIKEDVLHWMPEADKRYDCIYLDIWNHVDFNIYQKEMIPLKLRYNRFLKSAQASPDRFTECWAENKAQQNVCYSF